MSRIVTQATQLPKLVLTSMFSYGHKESNSLDCAVG